MLIIIICINREEVILDFLAKDHRLLIMSYALGSKYNISSVMYHADPVADMIMGIYDWFTSLVMKLLRRQVIRIWAPFEPVRTIFVRQGENRPTI